MNDDDVNGGGVLEHDWVGDGGVTSEQGSQFTSQFIVSPQPTTEKSVAF